MSMCGMQNQLDDTGQIPMTGTGTMDVIRQLVAGAKAGPGQWQASPSGGGCVRARGWKGKGEGGRWEGRWRDVCLYRCVSECFAGNEGWISEKEKEKGRAFARRGGGESSVIGRGRESESTLRYLPVSRKTKTKDRVAGGKC